MVASGALSDYGDTAIDQIKRIFANETGVPLSRVLVEVAAASVRIHVVIQMASTVDVVAAETLFATTLATPQAASSFLAAASVDVMSTPTVVQSTSIVVSAAPTPPFSATNSALSGNDDTEQSGLIFGVVAAVVTAIVMMVVFRVIVRNMKAKQTALIEAMPKMPAVVGIKDAATGKVLGPGTELTILADGPLGSPHGSPMSPKTRDAVALGSSPTQSASSTRSGTNRSNATLESAHLDTSSETTARAQSETIQVNVGSFELQIQKTSSPVAPLDMASAQAIGRPQPADSERSIADWFKDVLSPKPSGRDDADLDDGSITAREEEARKNVEAAVGNLVEVLSHRGVAVPDPTQAGAVTPEDQGMVTAEEPAKAVHEAETAI